MRHVSSVRGMTHVDTKRSDTIQSVAIGCATHSSKGTATPRGIVARVAVGTATIWTIPDGMDSLDTPGTLVTAEDVVWIGKLGSRTRYADRASGARIMMAFGETSVIR